MLGYGLDGNLIKHDDLPGVIAAEQTQRDQLAKNGGHRPANWSQAMTHETAHELEACLLLRFSGGSGSSETWTRSAESKAKNITLTPSVPFTIIRGKLSLAQEVAANTAKLV